ncbi:MAG TPA: c-type cytochrome [Magnetospirillum sp.]|nr:c-type cytochrome [Magnetospirillum sp.]
MFRLFPFALGMVVAASAMAADKPAGPVSGSPAALASNCYNCHGTDGKATEAIPPLAGLSKDYLVTALKEYRDGSRDATIMHQLAKGYTEDEISLISDYFSQQKQ